MSKLLDSAIATGHHYFMVVLKSTQSVKLSSVKVAEALATGKRVETIKPLYGKAMVHCQRKESIRFGSESVLEKNEDKQYPGHYWYDFYLGEISDAGQTCVFVCFPYKIMKQIVERRVSEEFGSVAVLDSNLDKLIPYYRDNADSVLGFKPGFVSRISKYAAAITDDSNADVIKIQGRNPLESNVYSKLLENLSKEHYQVAIYFALDNIGELELNVDREGSFGFWMYHGKRESICSLLAPSIEFLRWSNLLL
ncbi:MAG: hypothetical protein H6603_03715 [Flavobacteriales bacterium]|nr:hypothetical protein [Flavobacteriales bacterium]